MRFVAGIIVFIVSFEAYARESIDLKKLINFDFNKNYWEIVFDKKHFYGMPILFNKKNSQLRGFINQELLGVYSGDLSIKSASECEKIKKHYSLKLQGSSLKFENFKLSNACAVDIFSDSVHKFQILFFTSKGYKNKKHLVANSITFKLDDKNFSQNMIQISNLKDNILKSQGSNL